MKLITDLKQNCLEPASVALGCFDGIHLGHQAVIGPAVADKMNGLTPSVFTFQENPLQVLTGNTVPTLLAPETSNQIPFIPTACGKRLILKIIHQPITK